MSLLKQQAFYYQLAMRDNGSIGLQLLEFEQY